MPNKAISQCYLMTQRMIGQQSLAEFMGLHVDIDAILLDNRAKQNVCRKGGLVINDGDNPTKKEINLKRERNKQKYGLGSEFVAKL